ncbi:hypothetical protein ACFL6R_00225 [Gemmatimonadota bacterium]
MRAGTQLHVVNRALLLIALVLLSSCSSGEVGGSGSWSMESIDPDSIRVIENGSVPVVHQSPLPKLVLEDIAFIGGADEYEESIVPSAYPNRTSFATGPDGQIGIADVLTPEISVYDSTGRFLWKAGRRGEGPGEFRGAHQIQYFEGIGWMVLAVGKYITFSRNGFLIDSRSIMNLPYRFGAFRFHFLPAGLIWYRHTTGAFGGIGEWRLLLGNLETLEAAVVDSGISAERVDQGGQHFLIMYPYSIAFDPAGRTWFVTSRKYEIDVYEPGSSETWRVRRSFGPRKYTRAERREAALDEVGQIGSDPDGIPILRKLPEHEPPIQGLRWISSDELWVFTTNSVDTLNVQVDVFDSAGVYLRAFAADPELRHALISETDIWRLDETPDGFPQLIRSLYHIGPDN